MILVWIFIATQVVDGWSTYKAISNRIGIEANPIVDAVIGRLGLFWGLVVTKATAIGLVVVAGRYGAWESDLGQGVLIVLIGFYLWICWNNLRILHKENGA